MPVPCSLAHTMLEGRQLAIQQHCRTEEETPRADGKSGQG